VAGSPFATGTDPRAVTADASGRFLYVANFTSNDISAFTVDGDTGALTAVAGSPFSAGQGAGQIESDAAGKFLYVANSVSNNVLVFSIDANTGALTLVQNLPTPGNAFSFATPALGP
jgi:6-phosphogluconolactonase (cycloisomerase 2 family)